MINLIQNKIVISILFLIVGFGVGTQLKIELPSSNAEIIKNVDEYGVPFLKDYYKPVVNGIRMSRVEFLKKYCVFGASMTCFNVTQADNAIQNHVRVETP
jgi:hypothetical protein